MSRIKTAIIGCGRNARELHTPILTKHPEFEVVGLYDIRPENANSLCEHFVANGHNCKVYDTREDLLASDVQFVVVLTDSHMHTEVSAACLRAGKHVLVTKPWALDAADADFIIEEAKQAKEKFGVSLMPFLPQHKGSDLTTVREFMENKGIGDVYCIRRTGATFGKRYDWQLYRRFGGGYLNNWGPHLLGQLMEVTREPIVKVYAETRQIIMEGDCEDMFNAVLTTKSGLILHCEFNIMVDTQPHWVVQGSKGTIYITNGDIEVHKITYPGPINPAAYRSKFDDAVEKYPLPGQYNGDRYQIYTEIAEVVRGNAEYYVPLTFTRNLTDVCDAIHKSAATGEVVHLSVEDWNAPL